MQILDSHVMISLLFWEMAAKFPNTFYVSINKEKSSTPKHLQGRYMAISQDIGQVLEQLVKMK